MVFSVESRRAADQAEPHWLNKLIVRILAISTCIVSFSIAGSTFGGGELGLVFLTAPLSLSLLWNAAVITVRARRAKPMHPGACVGCDLVIWLLFIPALLFAIAACFVWGEVQMWDSSGNEPEIYCTGVDLSLEECAEQFAQTARLGWAAISFSIICAMSHFYLFVWACVDTNAYRAAKKQNMYLQAMSLEPSRHKAMGSQVSYPEGRAEV